MLFLNKGVLGFWGFGVLGERIKGKSNGVDGGGDDVFSCCHLENVGATGISMHSWIHL